MNLNKIIKILLILAVILGFGFFIWIAPESTPIQENFKVDEVISPKIAPFLNLAIALTIIAAGVSIIFGIVSIIRGGNLKKTLITLGVLAIIILIGFGVADTDQQMIEKFASLSQPIEVSENTSVRVGAGLVIFYIMAALAVGTMIWGAVVKAINR